MGGWLWFASPLLAEGVGLVELVAFLGGGLGLFLLADVLEFLEGVEWDYSLAAFAATCGAVLLASGVAWVVRHQDGRALSWSAIGFGLFLLTLATVGALVEWHTDG